MRKHPGQIDTPPPMAAPSQRTVRDLLAYTNEQLAVTDPLEMNLLIAKEISALATLDIPSYKGRADKIANDIKRGLRDAERQFHQTPHHWKNDLNFFRLGFLCFYLDEVLGIRYRQDQQGPGPYFYTDPNDLFLNGVMDTRRGTCANMAVLHVAIGWRLRWQVSLACVGSHLICRYDDGKVTHNIEATRTGEGGFHSHPDDFYLHSHGLPRKAVTCGSDLRALTPREMLGVFVGLRARHYEDTGSYAQAEPDYLLARHLFPKNRHLHFAQVMASVQNGMGMFEPNERGHPVELSSWLREIVAAAPWESQAFKQRKERTDASAPDAEYRYHLSGQGP